MTGDDREVDFVLGAPAGGEDDEILDAGPPPRTARRRFAGLAVGALVVIGVLVVVRSNQTQHPDAAPTNSASTGLYRPVAPTFPTLTPDVEQTVDLGTRLCPPRLRCVYPTVSAAVRAKIAAAITAHLGRVSRLRIRDSSLITETKPLFARRIAARTPIGEVDVVAAAVDPNSNVVLSDRDGDRSIGAETVNGAYVVNGSIAVPGLLNGLRMVPDINGLVDDDRLVAVA